MPRKPWTPEEAKEANAKSKIAIRAKWARLHDANATLQHVKRSKSRPQALEAILSRCYRDFTTLAPHSPAAERLSRTILNLEQIARIFGKQVKNSSSGPSSPQNSRSGPLGFEVPKASSPSPIPSLSDSEGDEGASPSNTQEHIEEPLPDKTPGLSNPNPDDAPV